MPVEEYGILECSEDVMGSGEMYHRANERGCQLDLPLANIILFINSSRGIFSMAINVIMERTLAAIMRLCLYMVGFLRNVDSKYSDPC